MNLDVLVVHRAAEIGPEAWNRLSAGRPFTSYQWYQFGEKVMADCSPAYVVLFLGREPVARATFWRKSYEPFSIAAPWVWTGLEWILRRWPLLACEAPLAGVSGLILPTEPTLRACALKLIAQTALEIGQAQHASVVMFNYLGRDEIAQAVWPEAYTLASSEPGTTLPISTPDFECYLGQLSYKTRKNYRRYRRFAESQGLSFQRHTALPAEAAARALTLIRNVARKYHEPPMPWAAALLENALQVGGVWLTAEQNGRIVGCELGLWDGETLLITAPGLDYQAPNVYFLLGYADIRYAIESGAKAVRWGAGALGVKMKFGFQPEDNSYMFFAATHPWGQRLARWATFRKTRQGR